MIKALLFDKDGTLFDFDQTWGRWAKQMIAHYAAGDEARARALADGFEFDWDHGKFLPSSPIIAGTGKEIFAAFARVCPELDQSEIYDFVVETARNVELVPVCDLASLLSELRRDYTLGLATNDSEAAARRHLSRQGIEEMFAYIAGADSGYGAKPDAGMCEAFAAATGFAPQEIVMIGDSEFDLIAGKSAGMMTLGVLTGPATRADLAPLADDVIESIAALPEWLARIDG